VDGVGPRLFIRELGGYPDYEVDEDPMTSAPTLSEFYHLKVSDWLELADQARIVEIINGEIFMAPAPSTRHQSLSRELTVRLYRHVVDNGLGTIFFAPTGLKLKEDVVLEPDVLVVLNHNFHAIQEYYVERADLVVEILSPGTAGRDVGIKRDRYEEAGIPEYWIVDPAARTVEVLVLEAGHYSTGGTFGESEVLVSRVLPGFEIALAALWEGP